MWDVLVKPLHVGVSVADMDESIKWYHDMLGFEQISRKYFEFLKAEIVFLKSGDFEIELFKYDNPVPLPEDRKFPNRDLQTMGIKHVAYEVEDVTRLLADLKARGVNVVMGPNPMEGTLMGFINDNSGNLIEFIQRNI